MTRNIYALLVGIDAYPNPIQPLQGCVNDIKAVEEYLTGRVSTDNYQLHLRTLIDKEATRQGIINGFREHLSQATKEDIALFYYSGHGSQEQAPQEFWHLEPDRLNETIVCYDSRSANGWDLADKELGKLISQVAKNEPHLIIIMDCCHSGSGTRGELELDVAVRKAPLDRRKRPLESFIISLPEIEQISTSRSLERNFSSWTLPQVRYIFLSACRNIELAKEYSIETEKRGVFSYFLLDTLKKTHSSLTYRDLFKRTDALVRSKVTAQSPQIEVGESKDLDQPFLGGAISSHLPYFTVSHNQNYGWVIDGGAVHGIPQAANSETTELAIFSLDTPTAQLSQLSAAIGTARVSKVMPQLSQITIAEVENLQSETTYKAVVISLPLPPKGVWITGEQAGVALVRQAWQELSSLYIAEVAESKLAEWQLLARDGQYLITRPVDDRPLIAPILGYSQETATQAMQRLEHLTRWTNIAELSNPATSRISASAVQMSIYQHEQELTATDLRLEYYQENGQWQQPTFKVKLTNTSNNPLYCALLDLTDRYAVSAELFATGGVWLQPGESAWALNGEPIYSTVDRELWEKQGITEVKDILKLIISTAEFDATLLEQAELDLPTRAIANLTPKRGQGTLNRLMTRVQSRAFSTKPEAESVYDDWITSQVSITTVRPHETTSIPRGNESKALGLGVTLRSHPSFQAQARLTTVNQSTRALGGHILPPILQENQQLVQPFQFTASRGNDPGLSALELSEVQNSETVSKANPLQLVVDTSLADNEQLLPIAYDGEFFLPLGWGKNTPEGRTEINLERLPNPVNANLSSNVEDTRSLGGSIRIFFQKIISQKLNREFKYPILAIADVNQDETVTYTQDIEQIKARVAQAEHIVLYIHGIIGDTEDMVRSLRRAKVSVEGQERELADLYDLVLAFDYENLHTPIEENGRLLKQRLKSVGLGTNRDQKVKLHIVAHSMGGLVSRWFIEREGGNAIAQHLIMLGTPNAGSPWSKVEDWAVTMLGIGLNGLAEVAWPIPVLGMLMRAIGTSVNALETIDVALDQMQPSSEFLNNLAASPDPGIPYSIVAGNTSISPAALKSEPGHASLLARLMQKLFDRLVSLPFLGQSNDIAVTVNSIKSVDLNRIPQPQIQEVGCDHLVYFYHPEGLKGLSQAILQARQQNDSKVLVPETTNHQSVVKEAETTNTNTTTKAIAGKKSSWLVGIIIGLVAIAIAIALFSYVESRRQVKPAKQSQINTLCINCGER